MDEVFQYCPVHVLCVSLIWTERKAFTFQHTHTHTHTHTQLQQRVTLSDLLP